MDRIALILALIIFSGFSYFMYKEKQETITKLRTEEEKAKISTTKTMPEIATKFTFMQVTNQYATLYEKKPFGIKRDKFIAYYEWSYTFDFGYNVPKDWDWCIKVLDEKNGTVQVNAPSITQLSTNSASPQLKTILNGAFYNSTDKAVNTEIVVLANEKIKSQEKYYLESETIKTSVDRALSSFLQEIMNGSYKDSKPIHKVMVRTVSTSSCS